MESEGRSTRDGAPRFSQWGAVCDLPGADAGVRSPRSRAATCDPPGRFQAPGSVVTWPAAARPRCYTGRTAATGSPWGPACPEQPRSLRLRPQPPRPSTSSQIPLNVSLLKSRLHRGAELRGRGQARGRVGRGLRSGWTHGEATHRWEPIPGGSAVTLLCRRSSQVRLGSSWKRSAGRARRALPCRCSCFRAETSAGQRPGSGRSAASTPTWHTAGVGAAEQSARALLWGGGAVPAH